MIETKCRHCGSTDVFVTHKKDGEPVTQRLLHKAWCPMKLQIESAKEAAE